MKTFHFEVGVLYPEDPGVQIGDRVILQAASGQDLADFIVVFGTSCSSECKIPLMSWCIRYKEGDGRQPCILCGCDGVFVRTPDLEDL